MVALKIEEMSETKSMVDFVIEGKKYCVMKDYLWWALSEVKRWQYYGGSNFTLQLFALIAKADDGNKQKILKGFPAEVCAYLMWFYKEAFGEKYGSDEEFFETMRKRLKDNDVNE